MYSSFLYLQTPQTTLQHHSNLQLHFSSTSRTRIWYPLPQHSRGHPSTPKLPWLHKRPLVPIIPSLRTENCDIRIRGLTQKFPDNVSFAVCSNTVAWTMSGVRCYMLLVYLCKISGVYVKYLILYARVNKVCKVSRATFQKNGNKCNYWTTDCYEIFNKIWKNERRN